MKKVLHIIYIIVSIIIIVTGILVIRDHKNIKKKEYFDLNLLLPYIQNDQNYIAIAKYYDINTKVSKNKIKINFKNNDSKGNLVGLLNDDVLSFNINSDDENALLKAMLLYSVADGLGQLNGNEKGYVSSLMSVKKLHKYTLNTKGIQLITKGKTNTYKFKVNKKFKLGKLSDAYFTVKDLNEYKDIITGDGFVQTSKANLFFYKTVKKKKTIIYFCEPDVLTTRTYHSLLSFIELMYGEQEKTSFIENYPLLETKLVMDKYNITVDYKPEENENIKSLVTYKDVILKMVIEK